MSSVENNSLSGPAAKKIKLSAAADSPIAINSSNNGNTTSSINNSINNNKNVSIHTPVD